MVEKKSLEKRRSEKIAYLIDKEGKPQDQAVAMAYNMVTEQEEASAEEKLEDTANKLGEFRANISKSISDIVDSLGLADMDEDTRKEFEDSIVATLQSRLGLAGQVTEMSSMAGGAVQGYAGNAFIGEEDDD